MSMGTQSPLFRPVSERMMEVVLANCTKVSREFLGDLFAIMTNKLHTETLLFATLAIMIDRYRKGFRECTPGFRRGAGIMLSATRKDGTGKMQTPELKLIHDVFVELPMAGSNFRKLQNFLEQKGMALVLMHSCGGAIIPTEEVDRFYQETGDAQEARTLLDWRGSMTIGTSEEVMATCRYSAEEVRTVKRIIALAESMITAEDAGDPDQDTASENAAGVERVEAGGELVLA